MVVIQENLQGLLRKSHCSELSGYCANTADFIQSYGMQYVYKNPLSGVPLGFLSPKISSKSVTNTVRDFTKTLRLW